MVATTREAKLTEIYESLDLDLELSGFGPRTVAGRAWTKSGRNLDEIWTTWAQGDRIDIGIGKDWRNQMDEESKGKVVRWIRWM